MRKSRGKAIFLMAVFLTVWLSGLPFAYGQPKPKPKAKPPQRGVVDADAPPAKATQPARYYALVIGNNIYQDKGWSKLQTAAYDATELAKLLQERYGFAPPKVLLNATRSQILTQLYAYRTLPDNSNLLIYYAGHGYKDPYTKKAYWIPVDAQADNNVNWISASTITEEISALHSPHVLVISDSCYSGDLVRSKTIMPMPSAPDVYLRRMMDSPSRTLMASGRDEPVADSGAGGHSKFAYLLLESLRRIEEERFTAADLFQRFVQPGVGGALGGPEQVPQYGIILNSGHEFGDFVFSRGGAPLPEAPDPSKVTGYREGSGPGSLLTNTTTFDLEGERNAVKEVLQLYADAYTQKDSIALWKIWPDAPARTKQAIDGAFRDASSIRMDLQQGVPKIEADGQNASTKVQFSQLYTPRDGSAQQRRSGENVFKLKKNNGVWTIVEVK